MIDRSRDTLAEKADVAKRIASSHRQLEPEIAHIFRLEAPGKELDPKEPIKLLEINPNTVASGILPIGFSPHPPSGVPYPTVIVEIHTSEWPQLQAGQLKLPEGWTFDATQDL